MVHETIRYSRHIGVHRESLLRVILPLPCPDYYIYRLGGMLDTVDPQIDDAGHAILGGMIENLGLKIHCNARATEYLGDEEGKVSGMKFSNEGWEDLDVGMIVVSAGIRCVTNPSNSQIQLVK